MDNKELHSGEAGGVRQARLIRAILVLIAFIATVHTCGFAHAFRAPGQDAQYIVLDDVMITLRVAFHNSQHLGPYFNSGERVAANTSLFWPLVLSQLFRFTHYDLSQSVLMFTVVSALLSAVTVCLIVWFASDVFAAVLSGITLLLSPGLAEYGSSVWEHVPQMLFVTLAFLCLQGRIKRWQSYSWEGCLLLLAIAFLVRPDAMPLLFVVAACGLYLRKLSGVPARITLAACCCSILLYFALHHHLYGSFTPTTFHLKVKFGLASLEGGFKYLVRESLSSTIPVFVFTSVVLLALSRGSASKEQKTIACALAVELLYFISVGGDVFFFGRFFLMLAPIAVLSTWEALLIPITPTWQRYRLGVASLCVAVTVACYLRYDLMHQPSRVVKGTEVSVVQMGGLEQYAVLAPYLRSHISPSDGQIGLFVLGALSYYMPEYPFADFLGKADQHIADESPKWGPIGHNKWDIPYTLTARHVSVIPFQPVTETEAKAEINNREGFAFFAALQLDQYMQSHYTYRSPKQLGSPGQIGLLIRNDLLTRFPDQSQASSGQQIVQ